MKTEAALLDSACQSSELGSIGALALDQAVDFSPRRRKRAQKRHGAFASAACKQSTPSSAVFSFVSTPACVCVCVCATSLQGCRMRRCSACLLTWSLGTTGMLGEWFEEPLIQPCTCSWEPLIQPVKPAHSRERFCRSRLSSPARPAYRYPPERSSCSRGCRDPRGRVRACGDDESEA